MKFPNFFIRTITAGDTDYEKSHPLKSNELKSVIQWLEDDHSKYDWNRFNEFRDREEPIEDEK